MKEILPMDQWKHAAIYVNCLTNNRQVIPPNTELTLKYRLQSGEKCLCGYTDCTGLM